MLHLLVALDAELKAATTAFDFNQLCAALSDFGNNDLSAFFFDIRKDSLYCDPAGSGSKRRAYRTVLDTLFHALVRWAAPILLLHGRGGVGRALSGGGACTCSNGRCCRPTRRTRCWSAAGTGCASFAAA